MGACDAEVPKEEESEQQQPQERDCQTGIHFGGAVLVHRRGRGHTSRTHRSDSVHQQVHQGAQATRQKEPAGDCAGREIAGAVEVRPEDG